jgi:hypothetical protein
VHRRAATGVQRRDVESGNAWAQQSSHFLWAAVDSPGILEMAPEVVSYEKKKGFRPPTTTSVPLPRKAAESIDISLKRTPVRPHRTSARAERGNISDINFYQRK